MNNPQIDPAKVTRPIQLLAAWLAGLVLLDGIFLTAAAKISIPSWAPAALVIAAIVFVPLFLACFFLLMTRFRRHMQDDPHYSKYLMRLLDLPGSTGSPKNLEELQKAAGDSASELKQLLKEKPKDV